MKNLMEFGKEPPIHLWFELSYCSYLVLPRLMLQSMPEDWQNKLVALLREAEEIVETPEYTVLRRDERGKFIKDPWSNYRRGKIEETSKEPTP